MAGRGSRLHASRSQVYGGGHGGVAATLATSAGGGGATSLLGAAGGSAGRALGGQADGGCWTIVLCGGSQAVSAAIVSGTAARRRARQIRFVMGSNGPSGGQRKV